MVIAVGTLLIALIVAGLIAALLGLGCAVGRGTFCGGSRGGGSFCGRNGRLLAGLEALMIVGALLIVALIAPLVVVAALLTVSALLARAEVVAGLIALVVAGLVTALMLARLIAVVILAGGSVVVRLVMTAFLSGVGIVGARSYLPDARTFRFFSVVSFHYGLEKISY